uniref:Uncharacterized protein n=1 Tax=Ditylenchus dipsaci TaxID=166011 RepID=A0A915DFD9_9BILA
MQNLFVLITLSAALVLASAQDSSSIQTVDSTSSSKNCPNSKKLVQNFLNQFNADWKEGNANKWLSSTMTSTLLSSMKPTTLSPMELQEYYNEVLSTSGCDYLVKIGYFTDGVNKKKQYKCLMVFKKQSNGSYKVFRDNIKYP